MAKGLGVPESELSYSNEIDDLSHHERVSVLPPKELALSALTVCIEQKAHDPCAIELTEVTTSRTTSSLQAQPQSDTPAVSRITSNAL